MNSRKGRQSGRPLDTRNTMHLVLKSSKATQEWSLRKPKNQKIIREIISKFSLKYGIRILSLANVGNHLHFHLKLGHRYAYVKWIRAVTSAIAMKITGMNRWNGGKNKPHERFWDHRPFTRVIFGLRGWLTIKDYILINQLEGSGIPRGKAAKLVEFIKRRRKVYC